jgi:hypothetical protein
MLRIWRQRGRRALGYLGAAALGAGALIAEASDPTFETQSTLSSQVAPQNLTLDAAIDSMVRRGLLPNLNTSPAPRGKRAAQAPPTRVSGAPDAQTGWRPSRAAIAAPSPAPQPLNWRSANESPTPEPTLAPPDSATDETPVDAFDVPGDAIAEPILEAPSATPAEPALELQPPTLVASRPEEPLTSDDPLPDDHLAPIDDLPETPAPSDDAPGDPVEPEIGDAQLEGVLLPPGRRPPATAATPPAGSSLTGRSLTPVGEPDRIEQPDESVQPPSDPENYQTPDETPQAQRLRPLNASQKALRQKVRNVLKYYYDHPLNTGDRSPWEVMHCMLSYEVHSRVLKGGPSGEPITTVGWLCFNQPCKGRTLMYLNEDGDMRVKVGPALQGHYGQLLALLAQARVRSDYPMRVEGKDFTVADLIEMEKVTCYPKTELTFKLIGLQRYLDINAQWMNDQGMQWNFPTLLREEMNQPVRTAACGGAHRLGGLILTVKKRQRSGLPVDGEYAAAQKFVANYQNYAYRLQNADGSFSTEWFKGPGAEQDIDRRLKTTGHQLEFLIYAANDEQLTYYRTVKAVNYLANIMWANRGRDWEAGPLGHAIHALVLYDRLVFAPYDDQPTQPGSVAVQPRPQQQRRRTTR